LAEEHEEQARPQGEGAPERGEGRSEGGQRPRRRFGGGGGGGGRFGGGPRRGRGCRLCGAKVKDLDYKKPDELRGYLTERGKIKPRRKNACCAKHQRRIALAIKRARHLALLPFETEGQRG